ncbi:hypothetical protein GALMADRAFT_162490 [Galerina marginata CBS 339.88]|uniref:Uncharacterized protein n=1 Tax=Galerina marginata (strain CBS 339.88) TaxID=685588 RepID=A0A067SE87_GALM3|nr:hypothetical protein GALMADRAFT_162490 [Galerina marginata CBS 339.88]
MKMGIHENTNLKYYGLGKLMNLVRRKSEEIKTLKLRRLNDAEKLAGKSAVIDQLKQWVMAVGSGKVERVDRLVRINLARGNSLRGLLNLYERAAQKLYRPRNYTEEDYLRGLLLWRLGGARLAGIGHRALGLPSDSSLRRRKVLPPLIVSPAMPTLEEVQTNVVNMFSPISSVLDQSEEVVHQVLMFDELKVEERPRYDEKSNKILGMCREHGAQHTSLEFASEKEVELLLECIKKNEVHLAVDATVGALGVLSSDTRVYGARGILVSGDCKQESGSEHMELIKTGFEASQKTNLRTISIASDGESRRGSALVHFTFRKKLGPASPIYDQLSCLPMMNLEVGDDDVTADKDYKHVFKRLRNLLLRDKGLWVLGRHIKPAVLRAHMHSNAVTMQRASHLLNPNDRQDVKLAYDLLHETWSLPEAPTVGSFPGFRANRFSLRILGSLFRHIVMPYICIDLSLTEQLTHLGAAAYILMAIWSDEKAGTKLMPTQLYVDIMIMIKNVYFCIAKAKVDNPRGKFWIISLGTDRLETLFGILRTMVGNDANLDILQLGQRLTGTTEVATILAQYPHWDRAPRRLVLPTLSKDGFTVHKGVDHIGPSSWRGDVLVANVVLQTCWRLGRREAESEFPVIEPILDAISQPGRDIFSPLGKDLVKAPRTEDDIDDTYDDIPAAIASPVSPAVSPELEDTLIEEEPVEISKHQPFFELNGVQVSKPKYLSQAFSLYKKAGSTDRLKRVARGGRYLSNESEESESQITRARDVMTTDSSSSSNYLQMDMPIASLLKCGDQMFVCIGEVNDIIVNGSSVDEVSLDFLRENPSALVVSYQMHFLIPATATDDPDLKHDWKGSVKRRGQTYKVSGHLIRPINPGVSTPINNNQDPYYLVEIPTIKKSTDFPYREVNGKACFLCESLDAERQLSKLNQCSICTPTVLFGSKVSAHRVLEHNSAHRLNDVHLNRNDKLCGLCLRPAPACIFYLKKGKGTKSNNQIDMKKSSCANLLNFNYSIAEESTMTSPSSNVPILCPLCPQVYSTPAHWRMNLRQHIQTRHQGQSLVPYEHLWKITAAEKDQLETIWNDRHKEKRSRKPRKGDSSDLVISETHSSRLVLRNLNDNQEESDVEISGDEADDGVAGAAQQSQRRRRRCIVNDSDDDGCNDGEECENANDSDEIDDDDRRENEGSDKACSDDEFEKLDDWAMEHAGKSY